ncbi:unnamed protein product [Musa textilis]
MADKIFMAAGCRNQPVAHENGAVFGFLGRCSERSFCCAAAAVSYIFTRKNTPKHGKTGCQGYVQAWASDERNVERSCCECATTVRDITGKILLSHMNVHNCTCRHFLFKITTRNP